MSRRNSDGNDGQLDLFDDHGHDKPMAHPPVETCHGQSEVLVVAFPLDHRVGRIRDVATKLAATKSERHASYYRSQVGNALQVSLRSSRVPDTEIPAQVVRFWAAVDLELARQRHRRSDPAA